MRIQADCGGFYAAPATFSLTLQGYFQPTTDLPYGSFALNPHGVGTATDAGSGTARLEPGKTYEISVSGNNLSFLNLKFEPPAGYEMEIDGQTRTKYSGSQWLLHSELITVRVLGAATAFSGRAGTATSIQSGRILWQVALGTLRNGKSAGSILLNQAGTSDDWTTGNSVFTPAGLDYEGRDEIEPYRENGNIRQILANEACVDVVTLSTTSYELRFYPFARMQGTSDPRSLSGFPYVTYKIEKDPGSSNKLKITSETRDVSANPAGDVPATGSVIGVTNAAAPIKRTAATTIERTGSGAATNWNLQDWNTISQPQLIEEQRNGAPVAGGRSETVLVRVPGAGGITATQTARTYTQFNWGEDVVTEIRGTGADALKTTYEYYSDAAVIGSYTNLRSMTAGGQWEAYEYDPANFGVITRRHRPWLNSPVAPPANLPQSTAGEITSYTYEADVFGRQTRPTSIITRIDNIVTASATIVYSTATTNATAMMKVVIATRSDQVGTLGTPLVTITKYYQEDIPYELYRSRLHSIQRPDGSKDSSAYHYGTWSGSAFTPSPPFQMGSYATRVAVIHGTSVSATNTIYQSHDGYDIDDLYLVAGKSTMEVAIRDDYARLVRTEGHVWNGTGWELVSFVKNTYDLANQVTKRETSNGGIYDVVYDGEFRSSETDEGGTTVFNTYDHAGRIATTRKSTGPTSTFGYNADNRVISETISATGTGETIVNNRSYDLAGRLSSETPAGVAATTVTYTYFDSQVPGSATKRTINYPDLSSRIETYLYDGRLEKIEGTAVVPEYFAYGRDPGDGRRWRETRIGGQSANPALADSTSARWSKHWVDWAGRTSRTERPGFAPPGLTAQPNFTEDYTYDSNGRLQKVSRPGSAPTRYQYDDLGLMVRECLDVNRNELIDLNGGNADPMLCDRVTENERKYIKDSSNHWWVQDESRVYPLANNANPLTTSQIRQRLTGYTAGRLAESQTVAVDANIYADGAFQITDLSAPTARVTRTVDVIRASAMVTVTTTRPGHGTNQIETITNGLPTAMIGHDGLGTGTQYDYLGRRWKETDQRSNVTTLAYCSGSLLVQTITNAASKVTTIGYDTSGRRTWTQDATGQVAYMAFNARSQIYRQWGSATYPIEFGYDPVNGDRTTMKTFRGGGTVWTASTWPASPGAADTTTWTFDTPTGLLWKKTDALTTEHPVGKTVSTTYNQRGQLSQRTWARGVTTTYSYDPNTAELTGVDYSDTTPDVSYAYTRLGQLDTATQNFSQGGLGARDFTYEPTAPWRLAAEDLGGFYGDRLVTPLYESTSAVGGTYGSHTVGTVKGRGAGFELGIVGNTGRDLRQQVTVSSLGRFAGVNARVGAAAARDFIYGYKPDGMLDGYTTGSFAVSRDYDTQRDLVTRIEATWNTTTSLTRFDYAHTDIGQRRWTKQTGTAFTDYTTGTNYSSVFGYHAYNGRGELQTSVLYRGTPPAGTTLPPSTDELPARRFEYRYDNFGNRLTAGPSGAAASGDEEYTPNALNQYGSKENNTVRLLGSTVKEAAVTAQSTAAAAVVVNKSAADRAYGADIVPNNSAGPATGQLTVTATLGGGADTSARTWFVPRQTQSLTYDDDGNLTDDGVWTYTWDAENRLTRLTSSLPYGFGLPRRRLDFKYDWLGRRVEKRVSDLDTGVESYARRFVYDGWHLVAELDGTGTNLLCSYVWGLDGPGGLLQIYDAAGAGRTLFATHDANGNVAALFNPGSQALEAVYEYGPFGEPLRAEGTYARTNPFRFGGEFYDEESGLAYYGYRYYSARQGRFINRDPSGEAGGVNLYGFCGNDGLNRRDLLGLLPEDGDGGVNFPWIPIPWPRGFDRLDEFGGDYTAASLPPEPGVTKGPRTMQTKEAETNARRVSGSGTNRSFKDWEPAPNSEGATGPLPIELAGSVRTTGETNATIEGKAAHSGFGQGAKLSNDTISDRVTVGKNTVGVNELKPEGRLANTGKFNQAINQLYRQMAAAAEKFKGKTVEGSLWVWQKTGNGFKYVKVMTIRMGGAINGVLVLPGALGEAADIKELHDRARQNGRTVEEQNRIEMLERGPTLETPYGPMPNPYWTQPFDLSNPAEIQARMNGSML